ncbi:Zinc finger A20 and AN1 domain-containing stress-associated protein 4 [Raphanus sativus]|nr:Zinc finger A20 and AN1 domain-containing stress-associated protein 4 [Raphanus sativus]
MSRTFSIAEKHRCQTPEGHRLCANNCGFLGSSATMNLCSNCYGDLYLKKQQAPMKSTPSPEIVSVTPAPEQQQKWQNRCPSCRKRVGLIGFKWCGTTFGGAHR